MTNDAPIKSKPGADGGVGCFQIHERNCDRTPHNLFDWLIIS
jgi:hypothetical protein